MENLTPLTLPVPPLFEQVMGYPGDRKWVAFYWSPYGDDLEFYDGYSGGTIDWRGWLQFVRHKLVRPLISDFDFGSSDSDSVHWLLLDRQTRVFYAGPKKDVEQFIGTFISQREVGPVEITFDQLNDIIDTIQQCSQSPTPDQINAMLVEKQRMIENMVGWLNNLYREIIDNDR